MSMKYIRDYYGVPARRGTRVRFTGSDRGPIVGTIASSQGSALQVMFDGDKRTSLVHPTWELEYLPTESETTE